jgi:hypothetical protein
LTGPYFLKGYFLATEDTEDTELKKILLSVPLSFNFLFLFQEIIPMPQGEFLCPFGLRVPPASVLSVAKKQKRGNANKYQKPLFLRPGKYLPTAWGLVPTAQEVSSYGPGNRSYDPGTTFPRAKSPLLYRFSHFKKKTGHPFRPDKTTHFPDSLTYLEIENLCPKQGTPTICLTLLRSLTNAGIHINILRKEKKNVIYKRYL